MNVIRAIDILAVSLAFGATVWFFFIQSPVLFKKLGRAAFVPIQMRMTVVFFRVLSVLTATMVIAVAAQGGSLTSFEMLTANIALVACLINQFLIVPRALRAGGESRKGISGKDDESSPVAFASEGAGSRTALLHRLVVLFVAVMLVGLSLHSLQEVIG